MRLRITDFPNEFEMESTDEELSGVLISFYLSISFSNSFTLSGASSRNVQNATSNDHARSCVIL